MPGDETRTSNANEEHLEKTFRGSRPVYDAGNISWKRRKDPNWYFWSPVFDPEMGGYWYRNIIAFLIFSRNKKFLSTYTGYFAKHYLTSNGNNGPRYLLQKWPWTRSICLKRGNVTNDPCSEISVGYVRRCITLTCRKNAGLQNNTSFFGFSTAHCLTGGWCGYFTKWEKTLPFRSQSSSIRINNRSNQLLQYLGYFYH